MKHGIVAVKGRRFSAPKAMGDAMDHVGTASQAVQASAKPGRSGSEDRDNGRLFMRIASPQRGPEEHPLSSVPSLYPVVTPFLWKFSVPPYLRESPYRL